MNDYRKLLTRDDALLLVVDIQKVIFDLCVEKDRVEKNLEALVDTAATLGLPAVFTEHNAQKLGGFEPSLPERSPDRPILNKVEFGCFANRAIREEVESSGKKTILLAGIESHVCIFQTAAQALSAGYAVHVVADAVSARSKSNVKIGLKRMRDAGAVLTSVEMAIFELLGKAATDDFRKMLPVVKRL